MTLSTPTILLSNDLQGIREYAKARTKNTMTVLFCIGGAIEVEVNHRKFHIGKNDLYVRLPSLDVDFGVYDHSMDFTFYQLTMHESLFEQMMSVVKLPDLMIYLRASVPHLVSNIQKRGRDYEQAIQLEYLQNLNSRYDDFVYNKYQGRVITIEKDNLDFLNTPRDLAGIIDKIDATLFGLF